MDRIDKSVKRDTIDASGPTTGVKLGKTTRTSPILSVNHGSPIYEGFDRCFPWRVAEQECPVTGRKLKANKVNRKTGIPRRFYE